jgi:gliding motility-associated-like protein
VPASVIIQSDLDTVCQGADVTITATPTNGGTMPTYQWYRNGVAVILSSPTYTFKPNDRDSVYVIMSSNGLKCVSGSPARSNAIGFTVHPLPVISSPALPNLSVYVGDTISPLTVVADSTKSKITYQWYVNKSNTIVSADSILGANSSSYLPSTASPSVNYYFCTVRSAIGNCEVFSSIARVEVLQKNILLSTELSNETCNGESDGAIILHISGGSPIRMSKVPYVIKIKKLNDVSSPFAPVSHGAIVEHSSKSVLLRTYNDTISHLGGGEYEITITDSLGKQVIDTLVITSPPALAATGSAIQSNPKSKQVAEITVSISGGVPPYKYVWTKGQIVLSDTTLHITNPTSGTYFFTVTDSCSEVVLTFTINESLPANTFTPNGDGTNDLFYENVFLQIFNRNGILLYEGTSGWDGTFNNQPVQEDTYMYVVKIKSDAEYEYKTGYVTVVR